MLPQPRSSRPHHIDHSLAARPIVLEVPRMSGHSYPTITADLAAFTSIDLPFHATIDAHVEARVVGSNGIILMDLRQSLTGLSEADGARSPSTEP